MRLNLTPRHERPIGLAALLLLGQVGCASQPYMLPTPPSEQVRAQFGRVAVVAPRFVPPTAFQTPARGGVAGAGRGMAIGLGAGAEAAGGSYPPNILLIPLFTLIGGIAGAAMAAPAGAIDEAEAALRGALADWNPQEALRDRVVAAAQRQTRYPIVLLPAQESPAPNAHIDYRLLTSEGVDTVLEVAVHQLALAGAWAPNPPLAVVLTVRTRLVRVVDGTDLYAHTLEYQSAPRKFIEWAANNARPFRDELDQAYAILAEKIVEEVFLLYLLGDQGAESAGRLPIRAVAAPWARG